MSGGFGAGPIEKVLEGLNASKLEIQVIAVCGRNKKVYESISNKDYKLQAYSCRIYR